MIVASGDVVQNLGAMDWGHVDEGFDWARRFDEAAKAQMLEAPTELGTLDAHPDFDLAAPTPDHFIPALYLAGLAGATNDTAADILVDGYTYGSLSMTAYTLGMTPPDIGEARGSAAPPAGVEPDQSNI